MTNWTNIDATMPKFIRENPWILTHYGKCCVLDVVMVTDTMYAEITQLRADLAAERELADRLAASCKSAQFESRKAYNQTENFHAVLDSVRKATTDALTAHATRRNK